MILRTQLAIPLVITIPGSGTARYPAFVGLADRKGQGESPDGGMLYLRAFDDAEASLSSMLTATSGSALTASAYSGFPAADGWLQLAEVLPGWFKFEMACSSEADAAQARIELGWRADGEPVTTSGVFTVAASAGGGAVDLTPVTDVLGTPQSASLCEDISNIANMLGVATTVTVTGDMGEAIDLIANRIGAPVGADISADIASVLYQTQVTNNYVPNIGGAVSLCQGTLAYGGHTATTVKSPQVPASEIDYTGMRLLVRRTADGNAEIRTIDSQSFTPPRTFTVTANYSFTPQDGDTFAVLAP